ncbi:hypothetical protein [Euzebya sp.]|uniref:hypothetical protein n=1 Tax=Euzebya sp. TaxID=1971409 RepID=UPI00351475DD
MGVVVALLAIVVALLAVMVIGLLRTNADVLRALEDLGAGIGDPSGPSGASGPAAGRRRRDQAPAPAAKTGRPAIDLSGATLDGGSQAVRVSGVGHDTLLLFLSSGCLTCRSFWDALREPGGLGLPSRIRVVAVTKDLDAESPSELAELIPRHGAVHLMSSAAWTDYAVPGSPYAVLVGGAEGRVIGEGTGGSWEQVANLLAQASGDLAYVGEDTPRTRKAGRDMEVERDTDAELLNAGIRPGDPSLYPGQEETAPGDEPPAT